MTMTHFERRWGFPRRAVTLANWRTRPFNGWALQHVSELAPSAVVADGAAAETPVDAGWLLALTVETSRGTESAADLLRRGDTDCITVMKDGRFVADHAAPTCDPAAPHLVFSISKSLTSLMIGTLVDEGRLDPDAPVVEYLPEAAGSAYDHGCTVRHVLDMRVSLDFEETYLDPQSAFARYRRAMLWNPGPHEETLAGFLMSLKKGPGPHGGPFRYRSPNSDLLGIIAERVSGDRYCDLLRERIYRPAGCVGACMVAVDGEGTARGAGGVSLTARDLARIGEAMRLGGAVDGRRMVSEAWLRDSTSGGDRAAWLAGDFPYLFPEGAYRSKWYLSGEASGAYCGIGIHGQWLYVDPAAGVVIVRQSSQDIPVDDPLDQDCLALFRRIAAAA